jgi:hypothetical protein
MTSTRWRWQWATWAGYGLLMWWLAAQSYPASSGMTVVLITVPLALYAASEAIRALALRWHWMDLPGWALGWRVASLVPVLSVLAQLAAQVPLSLGLMLGWVSFAPGMPEPNLRGFVVYAVNTAILLWLWTGVWLASQYLRRWRDGEVQKWQADARQRQLELELLRAQLNPHFVFNALNNLRALISEDPARAREMVTRLSNTLRHTLSHSQSERVPLEDELAVVRDYIALLQVHHEERLQVQWQVAPDTAGASLPPMVLQLLVENAVKHGIAQTPGGGTVAIAIARTRPEPGAPLRVQVSNPGRWQPGPEAGIGLANLREQLQRVGGPGATCEIEDRDGSVHVTLTIPP